MRIQPKGPSGERGVSDPLRQARAEGLREAAELAENFNSFGMCKCERCKARSHVAGEIRARADAIERGEA